MMKEEIEKENTLKLAENKIKKEIRSDKPYREVLHFVTSRAAR